jgi:hypothetical protein
MKDFIIQALYHISLKNKDGASYLEETDPVLLTM